MTSVNFFLHPLFLPFSLSIPPFLSITFFPSSLFAEPHTQIGKIQWSNFTFVFRFFVEEIFLSSWAKENLTHCIKCSIHISLNKNQINDYIIITVIVNGWNKSLLFIFSIWVVVWPSPMGIQMCCHFSNDFTMIGIQIQILVDIQPFDTAGIIASLEFYSIKYRARFVMKIVCCRFNPCIVRVSWIIDIAWINFRSVLIEELFNFIHCRCKKKSN